MSEKPRNLVVVISHDMGQHMGCYGAKDVRTPNFDGFAAEGHRFARNFCAAPQCSPSRSAIWTGRFPHSNGVVGLAHYGFGNDLNEGEKHLAQLLAEGGMETHLFGGQHTSDQGSKRCGFQADHGPFGPCAKAAKAFADFLEGRNKGDKPFFAKVAFGEPHRPFPHADVPALDPATLTVPPYLPDIPEVRRDLADLEASCSSADKAFGVILESLRQTGFLDESIVVFTVDHGIGFPHAKMSLHDPGIETALLMRVPGYEGGKVHEQLISNVDLAPTLLDLLGNPIPANMQGRSFKGLVAGEPYEPNDAIFAEKTYHTYYDPMRAIRTEKWKLIANFEFAPTIEIPPDLKVNGKSYAEIIYAQGNPPAGMYHPLFELYDLDEDPYELKNLAEEPHLRDVRDRLVRRLRAWMEKTEDPLLRGPMAQGAYRKRMAAFRTV